MARGNAKDLPPPPDSEEFIFLARRVGYTTDNWDTEARHLLRDIDLHIKLTKELF